MEDPILQSITLFPDQGEDHNGREGGVSRVKNLETHTDSSVCPTDSLGGQDFDTTKRR